MDYIMLGVMSLALTTPARTSTIQTTNSQSSDPVKESENLTEEVLSGKEAELDLMWDRIQELKQTDTLQAQILYEKYRKLAGDIPPPIP